MLNKRHIKRTVKSVERMMIRKMVIKKRRKKFKNWNSSNDLRDIQMSPQINHQMVNKLKILKVKINKPFKPIKILMNQNNPNQKQLKTSVTSLKIVMKQQSKNQMNKKMINNQRTHKANRALVLNVSSRIQTSSAWVMLM